MKYSFSTLVRWVGMGATPIVIVIITILSLSPPAEVSEIVSFIPFGDKGAHMLAYMIMGFCMICGVAHSDGQVTVKYMLRRNRFQIVVIMVLLCLIGATIELVQPLFSRGCELGDLIADCIGGAIGVFLGISIVTLVQKFEQKRGRS